MVELLTENAAAMMMMMMTKLMYSFILFCMLTFRVLLSSFMYR